MPVGPRGEKRPQSPVASMALAMKIATGQTEEQYVDGRPWTDAEVIAMRMADAPSKPKKRKKQKKGKKSLKI